MIVSTISEKVDKSDADSMDSGTVKDEPQMILPHLSRAYSVTSEPPAYKKGTSNSVRIARLIAVTVVAVALILGVAIILAAYLQTRSTAASSATSTETNAAAVKTATPASPSALTGDAPSDGGDSTDSSESSDDDKDHRRLDTEPDLLEEFLENHGKILRLPMSSGGDLDINDLTKMFFKRNPLDKSKCVMERRPIGGLSDSDDLVQTLPITAQNASAIPFISGERISIICSSDEDEDEDDSDIIRSRPIMPPMGPRPFLRMQPVSSIGGLPIRAMMMGPFPLSMHSRMFDVPMQSMVPPMMPPMGPMNPMHPMRSMRPPFGMSPPNPGMVNNDLLEQRSSFNMMPPPPPFRPPLQSAGPDFRLGNQFNRPPMNLSPPPQFQQFQPFQPFQQNAQPFPLNVNTPLGEKRPFNIPEMPSNSQEKSHVPEHRMNSPPLQQPRPVFRVPERPQPNAFVPELPPAIVRLLEDLPDVVSDQQSQRQPNARQSGIIREPPFRAPRPLFNIPPPPQQSSVSPSPLARTTPVMSVQVSARPVTLPFLQVPNVPRERVTSAPVNTPFLSVRKVQPDLGRITPDGPADPRPSPSSFFERLIESLLAVGDDDKDDDKAPTDSMPIETRVASAPVPIRVGSRGLRMPLDGQKSPATPPAGLLIPRPMEHQDEPVFTSAIGENRVARSHLIQPRSVNAN